MKINKETKIGIFVTLVIAVFIWGLNFLKGRNLFTRENTFYAVYDNVGGLMESSKVIIHGYKVGKVDKIFFMSGHNDKIIVRLAIDKQFKIPKNSVAKIYSTDFMGTKAVDLILSDSKEYCNENDTLRSDFEQALIDQINDEILPVKFKAENLMMAIDTVLEDVHSVLNESTKKNISLTFRHVEGISASVDDLLSSQKGRLAAIFYNIESISDNLKENNKYLTAAIHNLSATSDSLAKSNLKVAINNANASLEQTREIMSKINKGQGTLGLLVNDETLYTNLKNSSQQLDALVKDIKEHPRRYLHFSVFGKKEK
ncbi:MAG: MlaD family protein [Bacteroidota bacterium]|nr:MlaD family protein [Bacteroidota bacterium]MDP4225598.1 MlaD family protein [Bacteroidota bacterium]MDP4273697.1 MlaD family protein [Bacteroidota bacterium]